LGKKSLPGERKSQKTRCAKTRGGSGTKGKRAHRSKNNKRRGRERGVLYMFGGAEKEPGKKWQTRKGGEIHRRFNRSLQSLT